MLENCLLEKKYLKPIHSNLIEISLHNNIGVTEIVLDFCEAILKMHLASVEAT